MNQFLRANGGEGIFWTIMIIIWIVSKATAASRKAKQKAPAPGAPPAARPKLPPRELQAFLDSLTGRQGAPSRPAVHVPATRRREQPFQRPLQETPIVRREPTIAAPNLVAEVMKSRQMSLLNTSVRDLITDIPSARMPNLSMGFFSPQNSAGSPDKPNLRNHSQLRKAMMGHVILSRPTSTGW